MVTRVNQEELVYDPKRKMRDLATQGIDSLSEANGDNSSQLLGLTFHDYERITSGFSESRNFLGSGSTGSTYYGKL